MVDVELRANRPIKEGISLIVLASDTDKQDIMRVEKP